MRREQSASGSQQSSKYQPLIHHTMDTRKVFWKPTFL